MSALPTPAGPFVRFRVYPEKRRHHYFNVLVFPSRRRMYAFNKIRFSGFPGAKGENFDAITLPYRFETGSRELKREIGTILFHRQRIGAGCVSHEMTHAAIHFLDFIGMTPADLAEHKSEEKFARLVGNLTRQFYQSY